MTQQAVVARERGWPWLAGVLAAHALLLALVFTGSAAPVASITPPALIGQLVSAPSPLPVEAPRPPRKPQPMERRPAPAKTPTPSAPPAAANVPASERAVTLPAADRAGDQPAAAPAGPVAAPSVPAAASAAVASAPATAPAPAPVTPPRVDAAHLNNPAPGYPALSRRLGEQGQVLLDVHILADGSVGGIKLRRSSGFHRLDGAALEAVRHWRYVPARRGTEPIPYWYVQPVTFSLNG